MFLILSCVKLIGFNCFLMILKRFWFSCTNKFAFSASKTPEPPILHKILKIVKIVQNHLSGTACYILTYCEVVGIFLVLSYIN